MISPYNIKQTQEQTKNQLKPETLTSRTWKRLVRDLDTGPQSTAAREADLETGGTAVQWEE